MFYVVSSFFMFLSRLFPLCIASDFHQNVHIDQAANSAREDQLYRCARSVLELPPQAVGGMFHVTALPAYSPSKISDVKKELYDLWGSEEIESRLWNANDLVSGNSLRQCGVKVWSCTRNSREISYPVGFILFFWSNIKHHEPNFPKDALSTELLKWCDDFVNDELVSKEVLLTAHGDGVWPAVLVATRLISKNVGKNLKVIFFNPSVDLMGSLTSIPQEKLLLIVPPNNKYNYGTVISGPFKNKKDVAHLYEVEKSRIMSSLGMSPVWSLSHDYKCRTLTLGVIVAIIYFVYNKKTDQNWGSIATCKSSIGTLVRFMRNYLDFYT